MARPGSFEDEAWKRAEQYGKNAWKAIDQIRKEIDREYKDSIRRELELKDGKMHNVG